MSIPRLPYVKYIITTLFIMLLLTTIQQLQISLDTNIKPASKLEDLKYLPNGKFLKGAALSYDEIFADILWIKALIYFADHAQTDRNYDWLYHLLEITTTLDPLYQYPYEFAGIVLATELGDINGSNILLKRGMENVSTTHPRYWRLPFLLAYNHMYYKKDYATAAKLLELAAQFPQSPDYIPLLATRLYANADRHQVALTFLQEMINSTENPQLKEKLVNRKKELIADEHIRLLERARDHFLNTFKRYPTNLKELQEKKFITTIPQEPFGGHYAISETDHSIFSTYMSEKLILHIDKNKSVPLVTIKPKKQ
jgi:hypothetical protein